MHVLSIQSWVAYGHVGNAAAVFPLQRLGAEVSAVNTVEFSNHPGYGAHTGTLCCPAGIQALIDGIAARGVLKNSDALLTGYLGDPGTGDVILRTAERLRAANPRALWCCDPVIGDTHSGIYVRPGIADFFRDRAVAAADILTPNHFELQCLSGQTCATLDGVKQAAAALQARMRASGPALILVTSLATEDMRPDEIGCLVGVSGKFYRLSAPRLPVDPKGAGDVLAALFLFHLLAGQTPQGAMAYSVASLHAVLRRSFQAGSREMLLIEAQDELVRPSRTFNSTAC